MSVQELYATTIEPLSAPDRLRLATLILEGIPPQAVADFADGWSEEDLADFNRPGWERAGGPADEGEREEPADARAR